MNIIDDLINNIKPLDKESMKKAEERQNNIIKPQKALGVLENITIQLAGIYKTSNLTMPKKAIITFGSDNGFYEENVSKDNQSLTAIHFPNFVQNYSAIGSICEYTHTKLLAIDIGINSDKKLSDEIIDEKIAKSTKNITKTHSMSKEQAIKSIKTGINYANKLIDEGYNFISLGEMGIANTTIATAIVSCITDKSPDEITGRGSGINDDILKNKINAIKKSLKINKPIKNDYMDILIKIGGFETGGMLGVILACCARNTPVILDGLITYSAAMLAKLITPITTDYLICSHKTREKAGNFALEYLNLTPPLNLDLCLGEGYGAVMYSQIIESAIYSYNTMKTFKQLNML